MIIMFSVWITALSPQIYQQPVDNIVNKLIPLFITYYPRFYNVDDFVIKFCISTILA